MVFIPWGCASLGGVVGPLVKFLSLFVCFCFPLTTYTLENSTHCYIYKNLQKLCVKLTTITRQKDSKQFVERLRGDRGDGGS